MSHRASCPLIMLRVSPPVQLSGASISPRIYHCHRHSDSHNISRPRHRFKSKSSPLSITATPYTSTQNSRLNGGAKSPQSSPLSSILLPLQSTRNRPLSLHSLQSHAKRNHSIRTSHGFLVNQISQRWRCNTILHPSSTLLKKPRRSSSSIMMATQVRNHGGHQHHHDNTYLTSRNKNDAGVRITRIGLYVNFCMAIGKGVGGYAFQSQGKYGFVDSLANHMQINAL